MKTAGKAFEPDVSLWRAWSPQEAVKVLTGVDAPWFIAGGWAIDLFLGGQRREHEDLEIAVPRDRFPEIAEALSAYELFVVSGPSELTPLDDARSSLGATNQTWLREPETGWWRVDVIREPSDGDTWIFRRDARIRLPYTRVVERTEDGIPYSCPEVVLLYKAKHSGEPKHRADFAAVLPSLAGSRRAWLAEALATVHPGHAWLRDLSVAP
jgi:hypothetical protein